MASDLDLRQHCERRLAALKGEHATWLPHYRELSDYILPRRGRFLSTANQGDKGKKINTKIINSVGALAARTLAAGLVSGVTSPARPWFRLSLANRDLAKSPAVRAWLDAVQDVLLKIFASSNFYNAIGVAYEELAVFGTAAIVVLEDFEDVARFYTLTVGEYYLAASNRGVVDTMYREFPLTVGALVQEYGVENVSHQVRDDHKAGRLDREVTVVHAIEPNDKRVLNVPDAKNMAWRSIHYEATSKEPGRPLLRIGGYRRFCVMAPRWHVTGNDVYGRSPGMDALPDVKALQSMEKDKARAIALMVNPPMVAPPSMQSAVMSSAPGSVTFSPPNANGSVDQFKPAFQTNPRVSELTQDIQVKGNQIMEALYATLFMAVSRLDDVRSATEIVERREEKLLQLGPMLERLHDELLDPLIKRVMDIAEAGKTSDRSVLPPRPQELMDRADDVEIEYVSTLAQAQKAVGTAAIERFVAFAGNLAGAKPEALDKINADDTMDAYGDLVGVPSALIVDNETVKKLREMRAKQAQAQQALQAGMAAVQGAKLLSETEVTGGQNALSAMLGT